MSKTRIRLLMDSISATYGSRASGAPAGRQTDSVFLKRRGQHERFARCFGGPYADPVDASGLDAKLYPSLVRSNEREIPREDVGIGHVDIERVGLR